MTLLGRLMTRGSMTSLGDAADPVSSLALASPNEEAPLTVTFKSRLRPVHLAEEQRNARRGTFMTRSASSPALYPVASSPSSTHGNGILGTSVSSAEISAITASATFAKPVVSSTLSVHVPSSTPSPTGSRREISTPPPPPPANLKVSRLSAMIVEMGMDRVKRDENVVSPVRETPEEDLDEQTPRRTKVAEEEVMSPSALSAPMSIPVAKFGGGAVSPIQMVPLAGVPGGKIGAASVGRVQTMTLASSSAKGSAMSPLVSPQQNLLSVSRKKKQSHLLTSFPTPSPTMSSSASSVSSLSAASSPTWSSSSPVVPPPSSSASSWTLWTAMAGMRGTPAAKPAAAASMSPSTVRSMTLPSPGAGLDSTPRRRVATGSTDGAVDSEDFEEQDRKSPLKVLPAPPVSTVVMVRSFSNGML
ncbi:hypothetical protein HDU97_009253 [Phlyctochytrium planicorne]|nr:hypothetical protein HDU97_009253 [Phlyctochytrium planicorne]